jgi:hypothetical protein
MMDRTVRTGILAIGVLAVAAALVAGLGLDWLFPKSQPKPPPSAPEPVVEAKQTEPVKTKELTKEDEEFLQWFLDNPPNKPQEVTFQAPPSPSPETPRQGPGFNSMMGMFGGMGPSDGPRPQWQQIWGDLNLTEDEQIRLRNGFQKVMARMMSMTEEERQAERARFEEMGRRFQAMSDEEKTAASQRMKGRFDQWRQSSSEDLPELSLD